LNEKKIDQLIAASLTNAFYTKALLTQQKGIRVDMNDLKMVTSMTKEINTVFLAFQEVVRGWPKNRMGFCSLPDSLPGDCPRPSKEIPLLI
jgi:hypothetical protein